MTKFSLPLERIINSHEFPRRSSIFKPHLSLANPAYALTGVFVIGFLLRILLAYTVAPYPERFIQADAVGYDQIAVNLLAGNGFSREAEAPYLPDNFRTLVYPLFLALHYSFFGYRPELALFSQALIGSLTIIAVYFISRLIASPKIGLIAAGLFALSPHSITYTALLWSDTLYTFLLSVSVVLTVLMLKHPDKLRWVVLSSLMIGLATFSHPRSLYLPIAFAAILLIVRLKDNVPLKQVFLQIGLYILVFNLVLVPWRLRNYAVFGVPNVTSAPGVNMYFYGAALVEASQTGEEHWKVVNRYERELLREGAASLNEARTSQLAFDLALKKIAQNPVSYIRAHTIGTLKVFLPSVITSTYLLTGQNSEYRDTPFSLIIVTPLTQNSIGSTTTHYSLLLWSLMLFSMGYLFVVYALTFYALVKKPRFGWSWILLVICIYLAAIAGPAGTPRFQLPIIPLMSVLAALPFYFRKIPSSEQITIEET